jgi:diaminohydroxyphosphoribosylaminopyrimidine deaminase/5-amino-6-(5-phosphoribosylamino)uracil reductase
MHAALGLAHRGLGRVWPNPSVGCVLVKRDRVVGRGFTGPGGRPHAETEALAAAGREAALGATAYVTLEPCSHHGQTGPCAEALIAAGIKRAVVALEDPDPRVSGRGIALLREAGIEVTLGPLAQHAADLNEGFFLRLREGRPLVTVKLASSLDGRIATHTGESRWITGVEARLATHRLRMDSDAVMIGSGTALADNPELTCRLPGLEDRTPVRIVVDSRLRTPLTSKLVASAARTKTWIVTCHGNPPERTAAFLRCGVEILEAPLAADGKVDLAVALRSLGSRGLTRLLVEGGARLTAALLRAKLVDRLAWFQAPILLGGDGVPAAVAFGVDRLEDAPRFRRLELALTGDDIFEHLAIET